MLTLLFVSGFGLLGVLSRYLLERAFQDVNENFPKSTFAINVAGCAVAGLVFVLGERSSLSENLRLGLIVGFCGGFTTFSAYSLQAFAMIERGRVAPAVAYLTLSPVLGLASTFLAVAAARRFL